ncbi:MAG: ABC transporter permease, partial [Ilumatobacteraceae bacterium]|nr:ABC transporter permease [Ilumatobacteraceae bacterium]
MSSVPVGSSAFVWSWSRASLRRNWSALAGIALLLGLIGGVSLFAAAGARRTQSAYPRFLRFANPSTMAVDVGGLDAEGYEALAAISDLPEVAQARAYAAFYVAPWVDGQPDLSQNFEAIGSIDGRYFNQDRFTALKGRLPDPNREDEVAVNEESAKLYGYHVGQKIDFATVSREDVESADSASALALQPRLMTHATIVGVGVFIEEVLQDDTDRSPLVLFTPAYVRAAKGLELYAWQGLVLRHGDADNAAVQRTITEWSGGGPQIFRVTSVDTFHALQATRPVSLALAVFSLIAAVSCIVLVGQALSRHVRGQRESLEVARSIGAGPASIAWATLVGPAIAIVVGAFLAVIASVLASPTMPIGQVRRVEVARGIDLDWTVIALGTGAVVFSLMTVLVVAVWREAPHRTLDHTKVAPVRRVGRAIDAAGLPVAVAVGTRFSLAPARRSRVRSVMASSAVAVAALVAAVTFGASMRHLVDHPRLFGWDWNVAMVDGGGYGNTKPAETQTVFAADPNIESWSGAFYGADDVNGVNVPLLGMEPSSEVAPPIHEGRMIERAGEIVLGTATLEQLHVHVGDTVNASTGQLRVVGSATFPTIGLVHGDHTSLGIGGIVIAQQVPGFDRNLLTAGDGTGAAQTPAAEYGPNVLFVRFRHGTNEESAIERLRTEANEISDYNEAAVTPTQRSAEIVNAGDISGASSLLASAIAASAAASLALALAAEVRRRRRDLALLKALGFSGRQLSTAVASHATSIVATGLVV